MCSAVVDIREVIDVERLLVWVYRDQLAGGNCIRHEDYGPVGYGSTSALAEVARLGCRVDGGGGGYPVNEDAERVHDVVSAMGDTGVLLMIYGRMGARPDWMEGAWPHYEPADGWRKKRGSSEQEAITSESFKDDDGRMRALMCRVVLQDRPEVIRLARAEYGLWYEGLVMLSDDVQGLKRYAVHGPAVSAAPWLEQET